MPLDWRRSTPQRKMAFWDAKLSFCLLGLGSTVLLMSLAVPLSGYLLLSSILQLCAAIRCCLLRRYIFIAVNFIVLVLRKLTDRQRNEETLEDGAPGEASPGVWFDAAPAPTFRNVTAESGELSSPSTPKPADSPAGSSGSDESSCRTTGVESPAPSTFPAAAAGGFKLSEKAPAPLVEGDNDSMDAMWMAITGRAPAMEPHMKKINKWDAAPCVPVEPAARAELRKSETFQEAAAAASASARQALLERRTKEREVAVAEDHDEMNRRFEAFIKKFNDQLRLQRLASLRRRRFMDMVHSAGY